MKHTHLCAYDGRMNRLCKYMISNFFFTTAHADLASTACKGIHHNLLPFFYDISNLLTPCVDTSTVIPVSRKRRRKVNPVVSDEIVMYGYESSTTLTTDRWHYKLQSHPLVREGAIRRRAKQFSHKRKEKERPGHGPQSGARHQDILTD
jgi:hypothetical protein